MLRSQSTIIVLLITRLFFAVPVAAQRYDSNEIARDTSNAEKMRNGWHVVETRYVRIVFRLADAGAAEELLLWADDVFEAVREYVGSTYASKVTCVLRSDSDFANGSYQPVAPHINLNIAAPSGPLMAATTESWLKVVFAHEIEHFLQMQRSDGVIGFLSQVFGPTVAAGVGVFLPGWFVEGPAVAAETFVTDGGRGRNQFFLMYSRALVFDDAFFSLNRAAHSSRFPPPGRIYLAGYHFVSFLETRFGADAVRSILARYVAFPFFGPWRAIRWVTGQSASELHREMTDKIRVDSVSDLRRGDRVSPKRYGNYYLPIVTANGLFAYRSTPDRPTGIVSRDPATGEETFLLQTRLSDAYSLTSDAAGSVIVFAAKTTRIDRGERETVSELFAFESHTGATRRLTRSGGLRHPALSPDGSTLIAVRQEGSYASIVEIEPASGDDRLVVRIKETNIYNPVISSDGRTAIFILNDRGAQDIASIDLASPTISSAEDHGGNYNDTRVRMLTDSPDIGEYYPRISGTYLLFGSDGDETLEVRGIDLKTGSEYLFANDPVGAFAGVSVGDSFLYATYSSLGFAVHRLPLAPIALERSGGTETPRVAESSRASATEESDMSKTTAEARGAAGDASGYVDLPRFAFWFPHPFVIDPFTNRVTGYGPGFYLYGRSPVNGHELSVETALRLDVFQPMIRIDLELNPGSHKLDVQLRHRYRESLLAAGQTSELLIIHTVPLALYERYPIHRAISIGWMARYRVEQESGNPFYPFAAPSMPTHQVVLSALAGARFERLGSANAAVAPWGLSLGFRLDSAILNATPNYPTWFAQADFAGTVPFGTSNHTLTGTLGAGFRSSSYYLPVALPTNNFVSPVSPGTIDAHGSIVYRTAVYPTDLVLPLEFHLSGVSASLYGEGYASFAPRVAFDPHLYLGAEIEVEIGRTSHVLIAVGMAARISTKNPGRFTIWDDVAWYIRPGGFTGAIKGE